MIDFRQSKRPKVLPDCRRYIPPTVRISGRAFGSDLSQRPQGLFSGLNEEPLRAIMLFDGYRQNCGLKTDGSLR